MNMPHSSHFPQSPSHPHLPHHLTKRDRSAIRHDFVLRPVDQERRRGVAAATEVGERGDGSYEVCGRRRGPGFAVGGTDADEEEREAIPFFEEGQDELGAWITGAHPA